MSNDSERFPEGWREAAALRLDDDEPQSPEQFLQGDPWLGREVARFREFGDSSNARYGWRMQVESWFRGALDWQYAAWRRLLRPHRDQVRLERALLALAYIYLADRVPDFPVANIAVGATAFFRDDSVFLDDIPELAVYVYASVSGVVPLGALERIDVMSVGAMSREPRQDVFPIVALPALAFSALKSVSSPTATSPAGRSQTTLQSGMNVFGRTPAGLLTPGTGAMFVEHSGRQDPSFLSARHVLGRTGSDVLDASRQKIGTVVYDDPVLDVSIADLDPPWSVDFRLPTLSIVPGAPIMLHSLMPVQMFGSQSGLQTGYVMHANFTGPSQPGASLSNPIMTTITARPGDSGALLCSGDHLQPGLAAPYQQVTSAAVRDIYTCAALGVLQGQSQQGVGPRVGQPTVFTPIVDVLAAYNLDPLVR